MGGIYGHLVGDALGVPYEFQPADRIGEVTWRGHGTYDQPPGTWSDDGALMLALLDSLLTAGFDTADQARRALDWQQAGAYAPGGDVFDIGNATAAALSRLRAGTPPEEAGATDALGNGSLMRILPVALVEREADDADLAAMAARASRVTHGSAEAQVACALYVLVARRLLDGEQDRAAALAGARANLRSVLAEAGLPGSREAAAPAEAVAALDAFEGWTGRRGGGRVVDSFWSAWEAFAAAPDYPAAVIAAVRYGNDTDTTAAIAGGLAGIYWGIDGIPGAWQHGLRDRHIPQALADRLVETDASEWDGTPWRTSRSRALRGRLPGPVRHRPRRRRGGRHDLPARQALPGLLQRPALARPGQRCREPAAAGHRPAGPARRGQGAAALPGHGHRRGAPGSWGGAAALPHR